MGLPDKLHRRRTLRSAADLVEAGILSPDKAADADAAAGTLPIAVTPDLLDLMSPGDATDPIARQFVPSPAELQAAPEDLPDPIGDDARSPLKGLVHRYPDRVLLKPLLMCPVYCRFCFRRDTVGPDGGALTPAELDAALAYIAARPAIWEVVISGGDPLMLGSARLGTMLQSIAAIPHVAVVRIHTRIPIADPARVTPALVAALRTGLATYVAIHCNHPRELGEPQRQAIARLADAGIPLLGQSVLLKGVNDDVATLEALMRALVRNRIKPYYLHQPDLVPGTAHLRPSVAEGQRLMAALRGRLSGIAQPTYVLDIPGGHGKVPIGPNYIDLEAGLVSDPDGVARPYDGS